MLRRRVPVSLRPVFGAAAVADKEALHSEPEVRAALAGYAQREGLAMGDGAPLSTLRKPLCSTWNKITSCATFGATEESKGLQEAHLCFPSCPAVSVKIRV